MIRTNRLWTALLAAMLSCMAACSSDSNNNNSCKVLKNLSL